MRLAHPLFSCLFAACVATALPGGALAQATTPLASDPAVAVPVLQHQPLPASGDVELGETDWHSAHAAVAEFPRGHADIMAWEAAQTLSLPTQSPAAAAAHALPHAMSHGMHQHPANPRGGGQP